MHSDVASQQELLWAVWGRQPVAGITPKALPLTCGAACTPIQRPPPGPWPHQFEQARQLRSLRSLLTPAPTFPPPPSMPCPADGDDSCAMGSCCFNRCFNTPHAFQLGWISAQQLTALAPGQSVSVQLPSQSVSAAGAGLRVVPSWAPGAQELWLGYRTKAGGDAEIFDMYAGKLNAYTLQPPSGFSDTPASMFLAALPGEGLVQSCLWGRGRVGCGAVGWGWMHAPGCICNC